MVANPSAQRAVETLVAKGYSLVLATMPMFPLVAVKIRLSWAGIDPDVFARITCFENSTSVKPKLDYYAENLAALGLRGKDVLMVGNNTVEDLAALDAGFDGFLVTDYALDPIHFDFSSVKHGSMEQFASWVDTLPFCANPASVVEPGRVDRQASQRAYEQNVKLAADERAVLRQETQKSLDRDKAEG